MKKFTASVLLILFSVALTYSQQDTLLLKYRSLALDYQQSVKIAEKGFEGASSLVEASKAGYLPKFDANGNYQFNGKPIQLGASPSNPSGVELSNIYEVGLWVSQPVYTGGYLKSTKEEGTFSIVNLKKEVSSE